MVHCADYNIALASSTATWGLRPRVALEHLRSFAAEARWLGAVFDLTARTLARTMLNCRAGYLCGHFAMSMSDETKSSYWRFLWLGIAGIGVTALAGFFLLSKSAAPDARRVTITIESDGVARLGGVPLLTTNIRDGTFAAMSALGVNALIRPPNPPTPTNDTPVRFLRH